MRWAAAALLLPALPAAAQEEPWHGIWAADPAWCAYADRIGSHEPAPVEFTAEAVRGLETACAVAEAAPDYENSFYVVTSVCTGEGTTWAQVEVLMLGEGEVMWRWTGTGEPVRLTRCAED
jgi:hypothetical protein